MTTEWIIRKCAVSAEKDREEILRRFYDNSLFIALSEAELTDRLTSDQATLYEFHGTNRAWDQFVGNNIGAVDTAILKFYFIVDSPMDVVTESAVRIVQSFPFDCDTVYCIQLVESVLAELNLDILLPKKRTVSKPDEAKRVVLTGLHGSSYADVLKLLSKPFGSHDLFDADQTPGIAAPNTGEEKPDL